MKAGTQPEVLNFGGHYYPPNNLLKDLERLIVFAENTTKKGIPNGSVFVYNSFSKYDPNILKGDVGCGITGFIVYGLNFSDKAKTDILKAVNELGIHIGQGNHFLDFTTAYPVLRQQDATSSMIYLHSDFNSENKIPLTYQEAKTFETQAKNKRIEYIEKLTKILGVRASFYRNWTHNSVNLDEDKTIYRKGAINLKETEGVGLLALNPIDGLMLYSTNFSGYHHSMQHGLGRIGSKSRLQNFMQKKNAGIARGYSLTQSDLELEKDIRDTYNPIDHYLKHFGNQHSQIGVCVPKLVVTTKL